jgi:thiamine-phosphate pyrophosphorylase
VLQLRGKRLTDAALLDLARNLGARCQAHGVPFVVNDRLDVALLSGADGLHLGQADLPAGDVKRLAPALRVGLSTHDRAQVLAAQAAAVDMIGYGPVFPTRTKENPDPVVGVPALAEAQRLCQLPVIAIGGITLDNLDAVLGTGVPLICAIGAVLHASDPGRVAAEIHRRAQQARAVAARDDRA